MGRAFAGAARAGAGRFGGQQSSGPRQPDRRFLLFRLATAAAQYGLTTQHRNVIFVVTPARLRAREVGESRVRIVNLTSKKFFGFELVDVLGHKVMMSDREKTALDCVERPDLAGGVGEAAVILANASRRFDWNKALGYMERLCSGALARRTGWLLDYIKADVPPAARDALGDTSTRHVMKAEINGKLYSLASDRETSFRRTAWFHNGTYPCRPSKHGFEFEYLNDKGKVQHVELHIVSEDHQCWLKACVPSWAAMAKSKQSE